MFPNLWRNLWGFQPPNFQGLPAPAEPLEQAEPQAVRVRFEDPLDPLDPLKPLDDDGELEKKFSKLLKTLRERLLDDEDLMLAEVWRWEVLKNLRVRSSQFLFPIFCSYHWVGNHQGMSEEEELQRRCKAAIQSMDMLCLDGRGRYFYC